MNTVERKIQPEIVIPTAGNIPAPEKCTLGGGVPVYLFGTGTLDLLRIEFVFNAGQMMEDISLAATTANAMLTEGTDLHDAMTLNDLIDMTGAVFTHNADKDTACLIVITLSRKLDEVMALAEEVLFHPSFPEKEFRMLMDKRIQAFQTNRQKTSVIAREQFYSALFGSTNPYGRIAVIEDYKAMTAEIARNFHSRFYRRENMYITIAGKNPEKALPVMEKHFACTGGVKWMRPSIPAMTFETASPGRIFAEVADSVQSAVRLGWIGITREHDDFQSLQVANMLLGGYFGSRLMKNIREDKGFTYGINSIASSLHKVGFITIVTEVANAYREQTLEEIKKEIRKLTLNEVEYDELRVVQNHIMGEIARMFDGPFSTAETIRSLIDYGTDPEYYKKLEETVKTISPRKIKELFATYYNTDKAIEIIAGAK